MTAFTVDRKVKIPSFASSCKSLVVLGLLLYILSILLSSSNYNNPQCQRRSSIVKETSSSYHNDQMSSPTNISHLVFAIAGTINGLPERKNYLESWWKPNVTRGYIFLDKDVPTEFLAWQPLLPPFRVSYDVSKLKVYRKHVMPVIIRIVRVVLEAYREGNNRDARWYVMGDDDTVFFTENLVGALQKYDHRKYYYIGASSESTRSNFDHSFEMAYGGGGVALSNALVVALDGKLDECIERYWNLYVSDHVLQLCLADMGVSLTEEKGLHQIDLHRDLSGFLAAHPPMPVLSLHHLDAVLPIFPARNRYEALNHLMKPADIDQPRLLQQAICYHRQNNWTFSVSWGYATHVYESIFPRSFLKKPLETFVPFKKNHRPFYTFNIRFLTDDPCYAPHSFFLDSIENATYGDQIVTTYVRFGNRGLPACSDSGNHSADFIDRILVFSPAAKGLPKNENRRQCCDITRLTDKNVTEIKFRDCMLGEVIA